MDIHDALTKDHADLRSLIEAIRALRASPSDALEPKLQQLKTLVRSHFACEEVYYRSVDQDKRFGDRGLIHQLRNDHAALIFGMESLLIRLRKKGAVAEWWGHFETLMTVFLPHMDHEEKSLFPEAERLLSPEEWASIRQGIANVHTAS
jgi:hemerythrin-like domain-containing protein